MSFFIYAAAAGAASTALFVWLWRRERTKRRRAEYAAETMAVRLEAEQLKATAYASSQFQLEHDLEQARKAFAEEVKPLHEMRKRIDAAVTAGGDQALADEWNALLHGGK